MRPRLFASVARIGFGFAMALAATAAIASMAVAAGDALAAQAMATPSCVLNRIPHAQAKTIEDATVFIALVAADGTLLSQGTGFIAAPGTEQRTGPRRIVTAAHVVAPREPKPEGARFMVFFSDGHALGTPRLVATGPLHNILVGAFDVVADDIALLEIEQFIDDAARRRLDAAAGLPIDSDDTLRIGEASEPGAVWGFSGAAAVDRGGHVIGVLTGADFRGHVTLETGSIQETNFAGHVVARPVTLPSRSLVVIEPIGAPNLRRELGLSEPRPRRDATMEIVLAGFPVTSCAATTATVDAAQSSASAALLSKWQNIGQTGAWPLPPHFNGNKLKFAPP